MTARPPSCARLPVRGSGDSGSDAMSGVTDRNFQKKFWWKFMPAMWLPPPGPPDSRSGAPYWQAPAPHQAESRAPGPQPSAVTHDRSVRCSRGAPRSPGRGAGARRSQGSAMPPDPGACSNPFSGVRKSLARVAAKPVRQLSSSRVRIAWSRLRRSAGAAS